MQDNNVLLPAEASTGSEQVQLFTNPAFGSVRVMMQDGEPWFIAKDVCDCLDLGNPSQTLTRLRDKDKGIISNDTPGGKQEMTTISESGFYELVLGSRKPEAKQFKYWVVDEVLPSIRRHGIYATDQVIDQLIADPDFGIRLFTELKVERARREAAEISRDAAIKQRAWISDASAATRKVAALQNQLGNGKQWKEVKAIPWLKDVFVLNKRAYIAIGKQLAMLSREMGYDIKKIDSSEYPQGINAYHIDVIMTFFNKIQDDDNYLSSYKRFY